MLKGHSRPEPPHSMPALQHSYTLKEVALLLRCSVGTVRNLIKRGDLISERVGSDMRVPADALEKRYPLMWSSYLRLIG